MTRFASALLFILSLSLLFFTIFGSRGILQLNKLNDRHEELKSKNRSIQSDMIRARNQVYGIARDSSYLEKTAREQLSLSKPGEIVYIFSAPGTKSEPPGDGDNPREKNE